MADENGTLLARQVRRFIEKFPTSKVLENVEESAKTAILKLGDPDYYADKSESTLPIPLELHSKRSFESQYKKLKKEYPALPDLKGQDKSKDRDNEKEKEKQEKEKEKEEREKKEKEEREKKEKEEREKREKEEREKEKEEREKKEKEEREKKEKEEREKREKENEEREKREKENEEREKKEKEEREKEKEEREKREKEEREKKEKEEREKREKEEREKNKSNLLDQLKSIPVEELQNFIQELGIVSRGTSHRGFRGTSADTTSSWNTREFSADTTDQTSGPWRKVRERLGEDTGRDNDCDFADVKFYLEYLLRQDPDLTNSGLTDLGVEFINDCPGSQAKFLRDLSENDPQLKRGYERYYSPTRSLGETKEKRPWARNPQAYRDRLFEGLSPDEKDWDEIKLTIDPDTKKKDVKGRITASVGQFLDVCLESLRNNDEERHYLALKSDYPQATRRFEDSHRGRLLTIKPQPKGDLKRRLKTDIKILNYSCADQPYPDVNPRMYFFGIDKKKKKILKAWARTTYCETKEFKGGLDDLNEQRKECGQKEIITMSRIHRRWPNRETGSNSDSNSDFDSDVEQGPSCAVEQANRIMKQIFEQVAILRESKPGHRLLLRYDKASYK
ncbi:hypothetical protein F4824DRAFT_488334 [Ustulina deusta]|nr:hypothetical protein F4824DRAFT_488334 [Ustulina deusta]